jgi:hypothetical protein
MLCVAGLALFAAVNTVMAARQHPPLRLLWVKGSFEKRPLYAKWNSFSRIQIDGDPDQPSQPVCWGLSPKYTPQERIRQLLLTIDAGAGTVLTNYEGDFNKVEYLKHDITNLVHYLRPDADVLVIGAGGGRDVLSALAFKQRSVRAVEINGNILNAVNGRYGDFTGHLDRFPNVRFIHDEARSYIARMKEPADIIQVSLIDTWAATAAGAFVMTENSLYTVEAWRMFIKHLSDRGVLNMSRWYFTDRPAETYRLTTLAVAALLDSGVRQPRQHIILVRCLNPYATGDDPDGVGTILVSKSPFTPQDVATIHETCARLGFDALLTPDSSMDTRLELIASGQNLEQLYREFTLNITPPTDDSPFFFLMLRLRDILHINNLHLRVVNINLKAVMVLGILLLVVLVLSTLCILVPLLVRTQRSALRGAMPLMLFFMAIWLGFMLIEISQMQRLIVFLGHPVYGLSVVLFALLLSSGLGSLTTPRLAEGQDLGSAYVRLALLLGVLLIFGLATTAFIARFESAVTPVRILVSLVVLFPIGFFMGMAFPMGMGLAAGRSPALTPWLWGINGAMSVLASVLAVVIALAWGISASFWTGFAFYLAAMAAFIAASRSRE